MLRPVASVHTRAGPAGGGARTAAEYAYSRGAQLIDEGVVEEYEFNVPYAGDPFRRHHLLHAPGRQGRPRRPAAGASRRPPMARYYLPEARDVEGDAMSADAGFRARHAMSFDRVAVLSDEDWMRPALRALSFPLPGKAGGLPRA